MKNCLFLPVIIFGLFLNREPEYLLIRHVGISDKMIYTIVISKSGFEIEDGHIFIVEDSTFTVIHNILLDNKNSKKPEMHDFGTFEVIIKGENSIRYVLSPKESSALFFMLIKIPIVKRKYPMLQAELENISGRLH